MGTLTGKRLRALRNKLRLSMAQMAPILGVTPASICLYENGKRMPGIDVCYRYVEYARRQGFDVDLEWIRPPYKTR